MKGAIYDNGNTERMLSFVELEELKEEITKGFAGNDESLVYSHKVN